MTRTYKKNNPHAKWWWTGTLAVISILVIWAASGAATTSAALDGEGTIYMSAACGCCDVWARYTERAGLETDVVLDRPDMRAFKAELGIPPHLESCHTMIVDGYFVEGHIPSEAVEQLLEERPDIRGIAMPGMPSGSPGMPGPKTGPFVIYAVHHDGTETEYMRI